MRNREQKIRALVRALNREHRGGCDSNDCGINAAFRAGCYFWAGHLLQGATECPETDRAMAALALTAEELEHERLRLLEEEHHDCPKCEAVVWAELPATCGNCLHEIAREEDEDED